MPQRALRYLERYGAPEHRTARRLESRWSRVAVIPVCDENEHLAHALHSIQHAAANLGRALAVLVINAPRSAESRVIEANQVLWQTLVGWGDAQRLEHVSEDDTPMTFVLGAGGKLDLLLVDRTSTRALRIPDKQGVGLARKVGCDTALALWAHGQLEVPWMWCTDADVCVPGSYFALPPAQAVAGTLPFVHQRGSGPLGEALTLYEMWLRYHVMGLARAGSPYAFHTVGSTLVVGMSAYAAVRGFPRRNATEDFYLLNKLAKMGSVARLDGAPIELQFRESARVPVGTGPAMARIAEERSGGRAYDLPHPAVYQALGAWIEALNGLAEHRSIADFERHVDAHDGMHGVVERMGMRGMLQRALESSSKHDVVLRHLHTGFDGLRTIQFLHDMERTLGRVPWREALAGLLGLDAAGTPSVETVAGEVFVAERERLHGHVVGLG